MPKSVEPWRLLERRDLISTDLLRITSNSYRLPNGSRLGGVYVVHERDGVMVVALTPEREVLLVQQYRPGVEDVIWELPAGYLEDGEDEAVERAKAELREETGYEADTWVPLGALLDAPGRLGTVTHCFLALDARLAGPQDLDPAEVVEPHRFPLDEVKRMIRDGRLCGAIYVAALYRAQQEMKSRR